MQHDQLVPLQVEADAELPAEVGDELDGLASKPLLPKLELGDRLLLLNAIDLDLNHFNLLD